MDIKKPGQTIYPEIAEVSPNWHHTTVVCDDGRKGAFFRTSAEAVKECAIAFKNRGLHSSC